MKDKEIEKLKLEREINSQNINFSKNFKNWQEEMKVKLEDKWDEPTIKIYNNPSSNTTLNKDFNESMLKMRIDKLETELELLKMKLLNTY